MVFGGWVRLRLFSSCLKWLWFLVRLMVFGSVFRIGILVVFSLFVSFSGV